MDKIWYRTHSQSEVIGRCGGDEKKRRATQNRQKSNAKQTNKLSQLKDQDNKYVLMYK